MLTSSTRVDVPWPRNRGGALPAGTQLDRYLVLQLLGRGGMGDVYRAYDPDLAREIAIKVLFLRDPGGPDRRRAEREAQAMARLVHPNVVRIYDVGVAKQRLFLAMELVEGRTLNKWLAESRRSLREIVRVMVHAGRGIVAAHAAGLIHRDIKPGNILVGADGRVLVADFGLARLAAVGPPDTADDPEGSGGDAGTPPSRSSLHEMTTAAVVGTPAYMAPEQRRGETDELTDQFSFCVTLYEALYGIRPNPKGLGDDPWLGSRVPERPLSGADGSLEATRVRRRIPRWLRRILRRGLASEPRDRFSTMEALLAELDRDRRERWIRGGVLAAAIAGVVAAFALAGGDKAEPCAAVAVGKLDGVWDAPLRAAIERSFTESGLPFAQQAFEGAAMRLDRWVQAWREQRSAICEATWVRHEQSERLLDARMECLDRRLDEARALVHVFADEADNAVVEKAVAAVASLPAPSACATADAHGTTAIADPVRRRALLALRGHIDRMRALRLAGKFDAAQEVARSVAGEVGAGETEELRPTAQLELGLLDLDTNDAEQGEQHLREAVKSAADDGDDELAARAAANLVFAMGYMLDRNSEALAAGVLADALVRRAGNHADLRTELLTALGGAYMNLGKYGAASEQFAEALRIQQEALPPDDPKLARLLNNYGLVLYYESRGDDAIEYLERARDLWMQSLGPDHPDVATALNNLGMAYEFAGRLRDARRAQERALAIYEAAHGPDDAIVASTLVNLGATLLALGDIDGAERSLRRAVAIREAALGPNHHRVGIALGGLADVFTVRGDHARALELYRRALAVFEASVGKDHPYTSEALAGVGSSLVDLGHPRLALEPLERALELVDGPDMDAALKAKIRFTAARALWLSGRSRARAVDLARRALQDLEGSARYADRRREISEWLSSSAAR